MPNFKNKTNSNVKNGPEVDLGRFRNVCITFFNFEETKLIQNHEHFKYLCYGIETCPTTSKIHYQGYAEFHEKIRLSSLKKIGVKTAHIENRFGTQTEAITYCSGPWEDPKGSGTKKPINKTFVEFGNKTEQGKRTDIMDFKQDVKNNMSWINLIEKHTILCNKNMHGCKEIYNTLKPDIKRMHKMHVECHYGKAGTGKTYSCYNMFKPEEIYKLRTSNNGAIWFDGYNNIQHKCILIDDYVGQFKLNFLLELLDEYPMKVDIKGGYAEFLATHIYFTSNIAPYLWYENAHGDNLEGFARRFTKIVYHNTIHESVKSAYTFKSLIETCKSFELNN